MKLSIQFALALALAVTACGGKKAPATTSTTTSEPAGSAASTGSAAGGACEAAGGKCTSNAADIACKSQPANTCPDNQICCVM
jgi:hypothetical protein